MVFGSVSEVKRNNDFNKGVFFFLPYKMNLSESSSELRRMILRHDIHLIWFVLPSHRNLGLNITASTIPQPHECGFSQYLILIGMCRTSVLVQIIDWCIVFYNGLNEWRKRNE